MDKQSTSNVHMQKAARHHCKKHEKLTMILLDWEDALDVVDQEEILNAIRKMNIHDKTIQAFSELKIWEGNLLGERRRRE